MSNARYANLREYVEATGRKKNHIAAQLGVRPQIFSYLLRPEIYRPRVDEDLARAIAALLNQSESYVRRLYARAA